jgi:hypothetical protein
MVGGMGEGVGEVKPMPPAAIEGGKISYQKSIDSCNLGNNTLARKGTNGMGEARLDAGKPWESVDQKGEDGPILR